MKRLIFLMLVMIISTMAAKSQGMGGMGGMMGGGMRNRNMQRGNETPHEAEPLTNEQKAQNMVQKINEKIPATRSRKDSLIIIYKNFYEELQMYKTEGNKEVIKITIIIRLLILIILRLMAISWNSFQILAR